MCPLNIKLDPHCGFEYKYAHNGNKNIPHTVALKKNKKTCSTICPLNAKNTNPKFAP